MRLSIIAFPLVGTLALPTPFYSSRPVDLTIRDPVAQWISQPQDHNDILNTNVWNQRYFTNDTFFKNEHGNSPVFLCVGGEGPAFSSDVVVTGEVHCNDMITLASEIGALVLALEHRFYGYSIPVPDFSTPNMKFLSSQQALADMANFVQYIYSSRGLDFQKNKLITWGGSYPGMMAGFFRLKYPTLAYGAVSASAPVKAQAVFQGYMNVVADSLAAEIVGGSASCSAAVTAGFAKIGDMLKRGDGRSQLASQFNVCGGASSLDSFDLGSSFTNNIAGVFPLQSNDMLCSTPGCNYKSICSLVLSGSDPVDGLARLSQAVYHTDQTCMQVVAQSSDNLTNTTLAGGQDRVWTWQTCNEFGFYQTCDPDSRCPFTREPHYNSLVLYYDQCKLAFGISGPMVEAKIKETNLYYGADKPVGTRVLYVNGQVDPWHALAILSPLPGQPAFIVPGASHHEWTHPPQVGGSKFLAEARDKIFKIVRGWLSVKNTETAIADVIIA